MRKGLKFLMVFFVLTILTTSIVSAGFFDIFKRSNQVEPEQNEKGFFAKLLGFFRSPEEQHQQQGVLEAGEPILNKELAEQVSGEGATDQEVLEPGEFALNEEVIGQVESECTESLFLMVDEIYEYAEESIQLVEIDSNSATIEVNGVTKTLNLNEKAAIDDLTITLDKTFVRTDETQNGANLLVDCIENAGAPTKVENILDIESEANQVIETVNCGEEVFFYIKETVLYDGHDVTLEEVTSGKAVIYVGEEGVIFNEGDTETLDSVEITLNKAFHRTQTSESSATITISC